MADENIYAATGDAKARSEAIRAEQEQARVKAREAALKELDEADKAREEQRKESDERAAKAKPTPTPREVDLAKLGLLDIDNKEDDGSGPELVHTRVALPADEAAKYNTRSMSYTKTKKPA